MAPLLTLRTAKRLQRIRCLSHLQHRRLPLPKSSIDCASAAKYSESKRGSAILVMQNGRTIFEHYANGGSANRRWPIFSGTKSFWGIAALSAVKRAYLDSTIPSQTRSQSGRVIRANRRSRFGNCSAKPTALKARRIFSGLRFAIETRWLSVCRGRLNRVRVFIYGPSHLQIFSELLRRKLGGRSVISYFERTWRTGLDCAILNIKKIPRQSAACDRI